MGFDTVRSMVARSPWSGLRSPFRANKLESLSPSAISPLGNRVSRLPRPFGPEPKIWSVFPVISASFRNLPPTPAFSGLFRLFPGTSAHFQTVLNWTFGVSLQFCRFNRPLQPTWLQHDRAVLFYTPSATHFASSTFRSSLAFNSSSTLTISG